MLRIAVAQALTNAIARPEQYMCVAGQRMDGLYFLAYGFADSFDASGQYKQTLRSGDFFGELALLTQAPRTADVTALGFGELLVMTAADFAKLLARNPGLNTHIAETARVRLARG